MADHQFLFRGPVVSFVLAISIVWDLGQKASRYRYELSVGSSIAIGMFPEVLTPIEAMEVKFVNYGVGDKFDVLQCSPFDTIFLLQKLIKQLFLLCMFLCIMILLNILVSHTSISLSPAFC